VSTFEELEANAEKAKGKIVLFNAPFTTYGQTVAYRSRGADAASAVYTLHSPPAGDQIALTVALFPTGGSCGCVGPFGDALLAVHAAHRRAELLRQADPHPRRWYFVNDIFCFLLILSFFPTQHRASMDVTQQSRWRTVRCWGACKSEDRWFA
jgi:hypothetical protein